MGCLDALQPQQEDGSPGKGTNGLCMMMRGGRPQAARSDTLTTALCVPLRSEHSGRRKWVHTSQLGEEEPKKKERRTDEGTQGRPYHLLSKWRDSTGQPRVGVADLGDTDLDAGSL